jgi:creatinine amidohydrolase
MKGRDERTENRREVDYVIREAGEDVFLCLLADAPLRIAGTPDLVSVRFLGRTVPRADTVWECAATVWEGGVEDDEGLVRLCWPVVLPLGVLEYHGDHLPVGMDTLAVVKALELLEQERPLVILPAFYYGAASYAVEPPEGKGTVHVDADYLQPMARGLFRSLLRIGFRNIHFFIHHQSENFAAGMPTDLAFKFAARQAIFEYLEQERGEGWWGKSQMADYYAQQAAGDDPFNWIKGHPLMTPEIIRQYPFDRAGAGETGLMLALCPETVDQTAVDPAVWYSRSATAATREQGAKGVALILQAMREVLR